MRDAIYRIKEAIQIARILRSDIVVVHAGFYAKKNPDEVFSIVERNCKEITRNIGRIKIGIETMPRQSQFGTIDEIMKLSKRVKHIIPVINIGHSYIRDGPEKTIAALTKIDRPYCHISGITAERGVIRYTSLDRGMFDYKDLFERVDMNKTTIVCDGPEAKRDYKMIKRLVA